MAVTKGPADPAVWRGAILGGRQIVVRMGDNFEQLNCNTSKTARFALDDDDENHKITLLFIVNNNEHFINNE